MASFRQKNGSWEYIVSAGKNPATGRYEKITKSGFRTKTEAKEAARRVEEELKQGTYIKESKMTFGELVEQWFTYYEKRVKVSTVRSRTITAKLLLDEWKYHPVSEITMQVYQSHLDNLSDKFSSNYIDNVHATGKMIFQYAEKHKFIKENPTTFFEKPRILKDKADETKQDNFLEREELTEFLTFAKNKGLRNDFIIFSTLAYSGVRIGELLALKESNINFSTNEITINYTYYNPEGRKKDFMLLSPKTIDSKRTIELDPFIISLLREHIKQLKIEKMKNRKIYNDEGFIFVDLEGYPMPIRLVSNRLLRLMNMMYEGVEEEHRKKITPHSFRHTNISLMIESGVPVTEIQRRVGHSDIRTTLNIYSHMTKQTKDESINLFSSHLSNMTQKLQQSD